MECSACNPQDEISKVADLVGRKLRKDGFATPKASCLAGIGAGLTPFIDTAKKANTVITIDGCEVGCAKIIIDNIGLKSHAVFLNTMGLEKGKTRPSPELTEKICRNIVDQF